MSTKISGVSFSPRCSMLMTSAGNRAYSYGGVFDVEDDEDISGTFYNDLLSLDLEKLTWRTLTASGKKKEQKSRRRKQNEEGGDVEDSDEEEVMEDITKSVESTLIADDGIFKVTVGPALSQTNTTVGKNGSENVEFQPSHRMNCGLAVKRGTLYLYGGLYEEDDKEITYNDMYALDLHKMEEWKTILVDEKAKSDWIGSDSEGESDEEEEEDSEESGEESETMDCD